MFDLRKGEEVVIEGHGWDRAEGRFLDLGYKTNDVEGEFDSAAVLLSTTARHHRDGGFDEFKAGTTVSVPPAAVRPKPEVEAEERAAIDHDAEAVRCAELAEEALDKSAAEGGLDSVAWGAIGQGWATLALAHRTAEQTAIVRAAYPAEVG